MEIIAGLFTFILMLSAYMLPTFIAFGRSTNNKVIILILNLFLGWTFIGWILCLAFAFSNDIQKTGADS